MNKKEKTSLSTVQCAVLLHFVAEDNHIYEFDKSWNVIIGSFTFSVHTSTKLKAQFNFQAQLVSTDEHGHNTVTLAHERLVEMQPKLEELEMLLDILTLHTGIPLVIEDGSFEFVGAGYRTSSGPVSNTSTLHDLSGIQKRLEGLPKKETLINAIRFYRLSLIDKEYSGKGIKLWSTLEALYKGYEKSEDTICKKLDKKEKKQIRDTINSQTKLSDEEKIRLIDVIFMQKLSSKSTLLSKKLKLMNSKGEYKEEEIKNLVAWWSDARNAPSHGERIRRDDEERQNAVDDCKNTVEMMLQSDLWPSMHAYIIGHPSDIDSGFWNEDDFTINKISAECWVKPTGWDHYLVNNLGAHKTQDNGPLIYVTHDKVIEITHTARKELADFNGLPEDYKKMIKKIQEKLNQESYPRDTG